MITFSKGDRVRPKKHGDSKSDAPGASSSPPRQRIFPDGLTEFEDWIEFDTR